MEPVKIIMCDACGTVTKIDRTLRLNVAPPRFCPYCGANKIREIKSALAGLDAACFRSYDRRLVELLWQVWATDEKLHAQHPTLLAYIQWRLANL